MMYVTDLIGFILICASFLLATLDREPHRLINVLGWSCALLWCSIAVFGGS